MSITEKLAKAPAGEWRAVPGQDPRFWFVQAADEHGRWSDVDLASPDNAKAIADAVNYVRSQGGGVPEGFKLVPVEPTGAQATAIAKAVREMAVPTSIDPDEVYFDNGHARRLYAAMLSASPVEG